MDKLHFLKIVIARFIIILFKRKKGIELLYLDYKAESIFNKHPKQIIEHNYIILDYQFKNGIFYSFEKKITKENNIKILNLELLDKEFDLIVYGFFQKKIYHLKFQPKFNLDNSNFKTSIFNLNLKLSEITIPRLTPENIYCYIHKPIITKSNIEIENKKIAISNSTFNQNDFI